jgi:hypothetical protein
MQKYLITDLENIVGYYVDRNTFQKLNKLNPLVYSVKKIINTEFENMSFDDIFLYSNAYKLALEWMIKYKEKSKNLHITSIIGTFIAVLEVYPNLTLKDIETGKCDININNNPKTYNNVNDYIQTRVNNTYDFMIRNTEFLCVKLYEYVSEKAKIMYYKHCYNKDIDKVTPVIDKVIKSELYNDLARSVEEFSQVYPEKEIMINFHLYKYRLIRLTMFLYITGDRMFNKVEHLIKLDNKIVVLDDILFNLMKEKKYSISKRLDEPSKIYNELLPLVVKKLIK